MSKSNLHSLLPAALLFFAANPCAAAGLITNGGFESNGGPGSSIFAGWTVATQAGSGGNGFYAQTGTASPFNGITVAAPPGGNFAAMTDSPGPSSQALLQAFTIAGPGTVTLSFDFFRVDVTNGAFDSALGTPPDSLDYNSVPNQQARVDILNAGAGAFDVDAAVVANVLTTTPLDLLGSGCFPADCSYQHLSVDLSALIGGGAGAYQLRFAEVDDLGAAFIFGVDNVSLDLSPAAAPEPGSLSLVAVAIVALATRKRRRSRRIPRRLATASSE